MENTEIIIFDEEDITITLIESYISALTFPCNVQKYNHFDSSVLKDESAYKIVILNITEQKSDIFNEISEIITNKKVKIIAMSYDGCANLQVKAFRAGAKDFLIKPLIKEDFIKAVQTIYEKYIKKTDKNRLGKIFSVISNRKGDGKSGFLINLAKEIADVSNEKVLLIDFNHAQNNISFLLNANTQHNTNYYINNLTLDNAQALLSTVPKYKESSLYIIADGFSNNKSSSLKEEKLYNAFDVLKHQFKYIFVDKAPDDEFIEDETIIDISDEVFCLILPSITSFDNIKNILDNYYKNKNIKIILNQYTSADEYKIEKIQSALGGEIFWKIPKNFTASNNAYNNNITLKEAAQNTEIASSYFELAKCIVNRD